MKLTWTFDIHKIRVRTLYKALFLVALALLLGAGVQKILGKLKTHTVKLFKSMLKNYQDRIVMIAA